MYVIVKSKKDKDKALKKHVLKDIVPREFDTRIEEIQEKHRQAITDRDSQIQALEFRNEEHQHIILKLNKEIADLIKTGTYPVVDIFTCYASSKRIAKRPTHIMLFDVNMDS